MFEDSDRSDQHVTVAAEHNAAKRKWLIKGDPRITQNEIEDNFNLSLAGLNWILRHHLCVGKHPLDAPLPHMTEE